MDRVLVVGKRLFMKRDVQMGKNDQWGITSKSADRFCFDFEVSGGEDLGWTSVESGG